MSAYEKTRKGFTLVELLVVISLIAILAAITITFMPNAASAAREARAATQLQAWLNIAKQRALRDQTPRGLRLWINNNYLVNGTQILNVVTECQYIEQPDDFTGGLVASGTPTPLPPPVAARYNLNNTLAFSNDLVNGYVPVLFSPFFGQPNNNPDPNAKFWLVQPGDDLELFGTGLMYQIVQVGVPNTPPFTNTLVNDKYVVIRPPLTYPINSPTANYRIVRAPRVVGDETLKLPENTLIDLNPNMGLVNTSGQVVAAPVFPNLTQTLFANNSNPLPQPNVVTEGSGFIDILFAPNGTVISRGTSKPFVHLWVRAPSPEAPASVFKGEPTLVSIFVKSGLVGAYKTDPITAGNPYSFVK